MMSELKTQGRIVKKMLYQKSKNFVKSIFLKAIFSQIHTDSCTKRSQPKVQLSNFYSIICLYKPTIAFLRNHPKLLEDSSVLSWDRLFLVADANSTRMKFCCQIVLGKTTGTPLHRTTFIYVKIVHIPPMLCVFLVLMVMCFFSREM